MPQREETIKLLLTAKSKTFAELAPATWKTSGLGAGSLADPGKPTVDRVKYTRVYTDSQGESHFEELELGLSKSDYAPPAPPLWVSDFHSATEYHFISLPAGWYGDWHPVPRRQLFFVLRGQAEGEASDGTRGRGGPGDIVLHEDTWGKGHRTRVVGDEDVLLAVVELPD